MANSDTIKKHASKLSSFLGLQRSTIGVLAMVALVGLGERMAERFLPIYMLALGGGALAIGLLQDMDNFLSALYSFPGGYLSDRIGTKKSLILFNLVAFILRGLKEFGEPTRKALIMDLSPDSCRAGMFGLYYFQTGINSELLMYRKIGCNRNVRNRVNKTEFGRIVLNFT
jgi:MFS family permease